MGVTPLAPQRSAITRFGGFLSTNHPWRPTETPEHVSRTGREAGDSRETVSLAPCRAVHRARRSRRWPPLDRTPAPLDCRAGHWAATPPRRARPSRQRKQAGQSACEPRAAESRRTHPPPLRYRAHHGHADLFRVRGDFRARRATAQLQVLLPLMFCTRGRSSFGCCPIREGGMMRPHVARGRRAQ